MNALFRLLYRSGAWLRADEACQVGDWGLTFLRAQNRCAEISLAMSQPRFPLHAKPHMLYHTFIFLKKWSESHQWCESPLVDATQIDESFVGVIARFSRRVSPRATIDRTYDLYMASLRHQLLGDAKDD